ncbi:MAG: protein translocase subunit SecD [Eubacteriaceae bacterium]|jgi:SecD/SecF fusion protein|nr:protein translocase subunit SecD [Eubacteriaceae bacterium]
MKDRTRKVLAILIVVVTVLGWYVTLFGIGSIKAVKDSIKLGLDIKGGVYVVLQADTNKTGSELTKLMEQTKEVINNRVDEMGIANPTVAIEGSKRIRVELPGVTNTQDAIKQIGKTAKLEFTMADGTHVLDGGDIKKAESGQSSQNSGYVVNVEMSNKGAKAFAKATEKCMNGGTSKNIYGDSAKKTSIVITLDGDVISAPVPSEVISGGKCEISGNFTKASASNLAALIRGGSLPVSLHEVTSSSQTAEIGYNALTKSIEAGIVGLIIIYLIMLFGYRIMGVAADLALTLYVLLIVIAMAVMGSVLTLPGIAGIILGIGMAVDGNVIIFSRITEEIVAGKTVRVAVQTGYKRALTTIIDSQVTTLIATVILYQIGTSAVKGFAWTLMLSVIASIFTAVFITQIFLNLLANSPKFGTPKMFGVGADGRPAFDIKREFNFIGRRKIFYCCSAVVIGIGLIAFIVGGFNYGIDFTGGTMMHINMHKQVSTAEIKNVMKDNGVNTTQMSIVFSGTGNKEVIIKTTTSLDNVARDKIIKDMKGEFGIKNSDILEIENFGATIGKELRHNAIEALLLAALGMLIYIRLRFREWKFGAAALAGLLHDVLVVCSFYAVFRITVNNPFIAAILTVVGYSINDTIVIFDRIRENNRFMKRISQIDLINKSINQTLTRSVMTSFTTLIVMVPLLVMTNATIREFILPLMVGVITGTYSSICLCSPLYYQMSRASEESSYQKQISDSSKKKKSKYQGAPKKEKAADAIEVKAEKVKIEGQETAEPEIKQAPSGQNQNNNSGNSNKKKKSKNGKKKGKKK